MKKISIALFLGVRLTLSTHGENATAKNAYNKGSLRSF